MRRALSLGYLAAAYLFIFLPVGMLVLFSFQDGRVPVPPFNGPSLRWHVDVLGDRDLMTGLGNSLLVATSSSAVALLLGFLAAVSLARRRPRGAAAIGALLVAPLTVSYLVLGLGLLTLFNALGVRPSLWTAGIGHVVINLPLCFVVCRAALGDQQIAAERAARDLGASEARVLALVTAPMIAPSLAAGFFLAFTFSWDEFVIAFLLTRFDVTLPVEIWSLLRSGLSPRTNAIGSLVFLVSVVLVLVAELTALRRSRA